MKTNHTLFIKIIFSYWPLFKFYGLLKITHRDTVVCHKTFHRYVVRAKRGTVQSQHDSSGKHAKSVGANIRRSQEAAFKDVRRNEIY